MSTATPSQPHTKWAAAALIGVVASVLLAVVVLAFLWPSKTSQTHNLPVGIAGPEASVTALKNAVGASGTFDFVSAGDRADAVRQIESRETYGAIVLGAGTTPPEVLTAPAGSAAAAQILTGVAAQLQAQVSQQVAAAGGNPAAVKVAVTPVVPLSSSDPSGAGLASASFPLAIGGMIGGIVISLLVVGAMRRLLAVAGFAVAAGLVIAFIMQTWFQYLQGDFLTNALAMGLTMLATSGFIIGCTSLLGRAGIAIGSVLTMFIGNPLSAAATPWQFLAEPWGAIGQFLVPGASGTLIRTLSYFPNADSSQQWWTLGGWAALGIVLTLVGHFRSRPGMHVPESTIEHPTEVRHAAV
ncbi:hypothetical protein [Paenarthrobacter nitroguajacolicus]|uniref:hypothetical protein n=1 Tax=Paenarthrobacter nitroguajacolicus TaxID=211146 RepID=UPI00248CA91F|nr:hypothetical protein [Paenarthrobacter nitroguajacolicus]MDI2037048.1 hypothetical protein [Paenarthrobacter nitroguajacolicus]